VKEPPLTKWTTHYLNPSKQEFEEPYEYYFSEKGVCLINNLRIKVNDDFGARTIKTGSYELVCTDVTENLPPRMRMK
jgi:hypothetical protein